MKEKVDLIIINSVIYTVDHDNRIVQAMAVNRGKIVGMGSSQAILEKYDAANLKDLSGKFVYPGFIDAHCHFYGYALGLQYIDLNGCKSFDEVINRLSQGRNSQQGKWIVGRGWDQNLWPEKKFPDNSRLNKLYPSTPVMLIRVDGHMVLANQEALSRAGFGVENRFGEKQVWLAEGSLSGILCENAADLMRESVPRPERQELAGLLKKAEQHCFSAGLTGVGDAGLDYSQAKLLNAMHLSGDLRIHIDGMLAPDGENINTYIKNGPFLSDGVSYRSIKIYADGSLGSRTARLKQPYSDDPATSGIVVTSPDSIYTLCKLAYENGYQVNTHCIGDSAVKLVLDIYSKFLKGKNDLRWRIEHAQVVDPADIHLFGDYSVIPSVQATHATSDMRWAGDRLGSQRVRGAYAYKDLMRQNGWIPNGTDFPIEHISPLLTFYAATSRKDVNGYPGEGFQPENALTREEALRSITIWAARAGFMEDTKGSLELGKDADFVVLEQDIMIIPEIKIPGLSVQTTYIRGVMVTGQ